MFPFTSYIFVDKPLIHMCQWSPVWLKTGFLIFKTVKFDLNYGLTCYQQILCFKLFFLKAFIFYRTKMWPTFEWLWFLSLTPVFIKFNPIGYQLHFTNVVIFIDSDFVHFLCNISDIALCTMALIFFIFLRMLSSSWIYAFV